MGKNERPDETAGSSLKEHRERGRGRKLVGLFVLFAGGLILLESLSGHGWASSRRFPQRKSALEFSSDEFSQRMSRAAEWLSLKSVVHPNRKLESKPYSKIYPSRSRSSGESVRF